MRDFRELEVWHIAHPFTLMLYRYTVSFPRDELYGLVSQLRRAAVSMEANIAEGAGKKSGSDFCRFLQIAFGSANEVDCELLIARDLCYLTEERYAALMNELTSVKRMLAKFIKSIEEKNTTFVPAEVTKL